MPNLITAHARLRFRVNKTGLLLFTLAVCVFIRLLWLKYSVLAVEFDGLLAVVLNTGAKVYTRFTGSVEIID